MQEQPHLFLGPRGCRARQVTIPGDQQGELAEASPNLALALTVVALAAALPCLPGIAGFAAQFGVPAAVPIWLNLFGLVAVGVKWASIAYGVGRFSAV
jgi:hypothetical protein